VRRRSDALIEAWEAYQRNGQDLEAFKRRLEVAGDPDARLDDWPSDPPALAKAVNRAQARLLEEFLAEVPDPGISVALAVATRRLDLQAIGAAVSGGTATLTMTVAHPPAEPAEQ
jgi:hypothetical protein